MLAENLRPHEPESVVSSEEPKAVETAEILSERLGIGSVAHPGLHEHDRTDVPFLGDDEFYRTARTFFQNPGEPVWGDETADQARERFEGAVQNVLDERGEAVTAVVAHGTVISLLVARHNEVDAYGFWRELGLPSFCILSAPGFELQEVVPDLKT